MLTHHRLKVYEKAPALGAEAQKLSAPWGRRHAIVEHFRRASESIVLNMAEGARLVSPPDKARSLDYALGSSMECAACLDIAGSQFSSTMSRWKYIRSDWILCAGLSRCLALRNSPTGCAGRWINQRPALCSTWLRATGGIRNWIISGLWR